MSIDEPSESGAARPVVALLVLAAVMTVVYVVLPASRTVGTIRLISPVLAALIVLLGVRLNKPAHRAPWFCMALSMALLAVAQLIWYLRFFDGSSTFPSVSDGFQIASALAMLAAVYMLSHDGAPAHDAFGFFEGAIISIAVGVGVWLVVVEPYLSSSDTDVGATIVAGVVPAIGALAFAAAFRSASHSGFRQVAPDLLVVGIALQMAEDVARGVLERQGEFEAGSLAAGLGVLAPLVVAAAALHPSMAPHTRPTKDAPALSVGRTVGISVAVLAPLTTLLALVVGGVGTVTTRLVVAVCALLSVVLALARLWGLMDVVRDLTERRGQDRLAAMVEHSSDVVILIDEEGVIKYASPGLIGTLGHRGDDWIGRPVIDLIAEEDRTSAWEELARVISTGSDTTVKFESNLVRVDGQRRRMEATVANLLGGDAVDGIVATFRDVTEQRNLERQLSHRAYHDELTSLANRALFLDRIDHALRVTRSDDDPVVVLFLDLDDFKAVNDALGHGVGDELLRAIADRVRHVAGPGDTPARLGGDEFALLLEDRGGVARARTIAQQLLDLLGQPLHISGYDLTVLASVGVAIADPGTTTSSLLRDADVAMYEAKRAGKGQIKIFDPAMRLGATSDLEYRSELGNALERAQLRLVYQPLVSLVTGEVTGAEALLRWSHPTRGDVSPQEFLPIAEQSGLIESIGGWVLLEAMREAAGWQRRGARQISINVSPAQLRADGFVEDVASALAETGLDPGIVLLEVTEMVIVEEVDAGSTVLEELRSLGVRLSIDDFGTGFCSLSYLQRSPVDLLKIDPAYIDEVDGDARRSSLARMILQMCSALGITSVAEGIERPSQLAALRELGCDIGQGHLLSPPLEVEVLRRRFGVAGEQPVYASANG